MLSRKSMEVNKSIYSCEPTAGVVIKSRKVNSKTSNTTVIDYVSSFFEVKKNLYVGFKALFVSLFH